jgi:hypothetical protein
LSHLVLGLPQMMADLRKLAFLHKSTPSKIDDRVKSQDPAFRS